MTPFEQSYLPEEAFDVQHIMTRMQCARSTAEELVKFNREQVIWLNDLYQVNVREIKGHGQDVAGMLHLSVKRRDKQPVHDWRHLQQIKNELVGHEYEAVEIYPAESRLVDTANQYHLWVFKDPTFRLPFGFSERFVGGPEEATAVGAVQRPFF